MINFRDFKGLKNNNLIEVLEVRNVHEDYYSVKLKINDNMKWRPGEHGIFTMPGKKFKGKKWRAFSVASTVDEGYMLIATRTGKKISAYKRNLTKLKQGDKVNVIGPFGWFIEKDKVSPIVIVAGGVGITPARALLKSLENENMRPIEIIYTSKEYFLFIDELKDIVSKNKMITLYQVASKQEAQEKIAVIVKKHNNLAYYYISGSFDIIKTSRKYLKSFGIKNKRLVHDPFFGY